MAEQRYLVTARKYRPALFNELVAQEHVTETLKNALQLDRLAHAYLFSGPRGVGKTTAARILAKAINCKTPLDERPDEAEPCRACESCRSFEEGRSLSIFEIDAASNNKVDDIRELRETVRIPPQGSQKKVYIIDEVHMLSTQAFNALLKTLEEPPPHALFIFATTEPHKVLPTILSRCQRFDFRRIPVPEIVERLREICDEEDITADEESLMLIARKGDGALRDALSAFDQAISLCGTTLDYAELAQALGVVDLDLFFKLTDSVNAQDSPAVLRLVEHVVRTGYDLQEFLTGLAEHWRNLLVACTMPDDDLLADVAESTRRRYRATSEPFQEADLLRLLTITSDAQTAVKESTQPRLKLEIALLKMAALQRSADLRDALRKLDYLERMVRDGKLPAEWPTTGDGGPAASADEAQTAAKGPDVQSAEPASAGSDARTHADSQVQESPQAQDVEVAPTPAPQRPASEANSTAPSAASAPDDEAERESRPEKAEPAEHRGQDEAVARDSRDEYDPRSAEADDDSTPSDDDTPPPAHEPEPHAPSGGTGYRDLFGTPALKKKNRVSGSTPDDEDDDAATALATVATGGEAEETDPAPNDEAVQQLAAEWPQFVRSVRSERIRIGSLLLEAEPVGIRRGVATIAVPKALYRDTLDEQRDYLLKQLSARYGDALDGLRFVIQDASTSTASGETTAEMDPYERLEQLRDTYPALQAIYTEFGGEPAW